MKVTEQGRKLVIEIGMIDPPKLSRRGKRLLVATSHGFRSTGIWIQNKRLAVSVNACIRAEEEPDDDAEVPQRIPPHKSVKRPKLS